AADPPDLLVEDVVVDREAPPDREPDLVRPERPDPRLEEERAAREDARPAGEEEVGDREDEAPREEPRVRVVEPRGGAEIRVRRGVAVLVVEPDEPEVLHVVEDRDEDRDQEEVLVGPRRPRVDRLVAPDEEV